MRDDQEKLEKILECIERVREYIKDGKENFLNDHKTQDAVIRNCQIVGEAVKELSADLRQRTPKVDWRSPARFRDKITHDYFDVNLEIVWDICTDEFVIFAKQVEMILKSQFRQAKTKNKTKKLTLAQELKKQKNNQLK